jgi:hypothetical protein
MLDHEVRTLQRHLEAYEVMERENSSLRERVGTLLVNLEEEGMVSVGTFSRKRIVDYVLCVLASTLYFLGACWNYTQDEEGDVQFTYAARADI